MTVPSSTGAPSADAGDPFDPPYESARLSTMRRTIGRRLQEGKQQAPHFYVTLDLDLDALVALRARLKAATGAAPSVNDFVIKAAAGALLEVPALNSRLVDGDVRTFKHASIALAVALPTGLVAPVIREADRKPLEQIATEARALAERARTHKLSPDDYRGATFTVSNLGMLGIDAFVAIVNPPQAGILALGRAAPRAIVRNGAVVAATTMTATLSADHRLIDGAVGAAFLTALQQRLAAPESLLAG